MGRETVGYGEARGLLFYLYWNFLQECIHVLLISLTIDFKKWVKKKGHLVHG